MKNLFPLLFLLFFVTSIHGLQLEENSLMTFTPDTNARGIYGNHVGALRIGTYKSLSLSTALTRKYLFWAIYFSNDLSILAGACVFNCVEDSRDTCEGFTEFFCEGKDQPIFKVTQERHQEERGFSKMKPTTRACRNARKTLNVQGNCCWKVYQRYRYTGTMKIIRNSDTLDLHFVPRSMKIMPC